MPRASGRSSPAAPRRRRKLPDIGERRRPVDQGLDGIGVGELELKSIIARELDQAVGRDGTKLSVDRRNLLAYYEGEPFGNEIEGRSQVVMQTVLETVEWVLPALLRIFTASDKIVTYEPTIERDEAAAEQATQYGNYVINRDNAGFMILHDWMKDALLQKLGWIKVSWDKQQDQETNTFEGLSDAEYHALIADPHVEVIEERSYPGPQAGGFNGDAPEPGAATLHDCKLRVTRTEGRVRIENVPPEEVLFSPRAKRGAPLPFICHRREWSYSELLEQGYDPDTLDLACFDESPQYNTERIQRFQREEDWPYYDERTDKPMREIWVEESYIRVDVDGDGIAELNKVTTAANGAVILTRDGKPDIEPIDEVTLIPLCPIPMPHKLVGLSVADLVTDLQLIKSTLVRQMLDNIYLTNNPRHIVGEQAVTDETYDDLLTSRPGGIIRVKNPDAIAPLVTPFVAKEAMPLVEYFDQVGETRTGVSRHNQGLNPDDLNKTATGVNLMQQAAAQRVELIARIFAETGIKDLARIILGMVTKYQQRERVIRLTGKWVAMDPRQWRNAMEVSISVGLGTGNRDQILQHLMQILQVQQGIVAVQKGVQGPLVTAQNIFDVLEKLTENAGFKESFFTDPSQPAPGMGHNGGPPLDPEMAKAQHGMQLDQAKAQLDGQIAQQRLQSDLQVQQAKAQAEAQLARERMQFEMQLEQQKAAHAMELERMREAAKQQQAMREIELRAQAGAYTPGPAPAPGTAA